ncbi:UNVERIFIED_CONTAM: G-patch domain-containing protein 1 [Sesamum latifolium]|uniref:G-patch domain-containing protein 1 n=1 Tax=Sesamum latifolium TaxID=2727402 RepID=A0AAW2SNH3_9LAMI
MFHQSGGDTNLGLSLEVCLVPNLEERSPSCLMKELHSMRTIRRICTNLFRVACASRGDKYLDLHFQDKATSGKQGLGIKDRPKKVAGCYFEGKKITFGDSDGEDSSDSRSSLKRKHDDTSDMDKGGEKPKLKKLCRQLLRQAPGESLKLKQLKELVDELSPSTFSNFSPKGALTFLKHKLENSDRFSLKGKKVSLVERS